MLTLVLAALSLSCGSRSEPPPPLSPANLPPQFPPKVGACPNFWSKVVRVRGSLDDCRCKAIATLAALKGIRYVELNSEGVVWGYTESDRWMVLITACEYECVVVPIITSWNSFRTELLGQNGDIGDQIAKANVDPKSPQRVGTRDRDLEKKLPALYWHLESRQTNAMTRHFRHFGSVAAIFMEKYGYETLITYSETDKSGAVGRKLSEKSQAQSITMIERVKEKSMILLFIGVAIDEDAAEKGVKSVSADLLKLLYE